MEDPSIRYVIPALKRIFTKFYKVPLKQEVIINDKGHTEKSLYTINTPI
jgi:hypothetical protein